MGIKDSMPQNGNVIEDGKENFIMLGKSKQTVNLILDKGQARWLSETAASAPGGPVSKSKLIRGVLRVVMNRAKLLQAAVDKARERKKG